MLRKGHAMEILDTIRERSFSTDRITHWAILNATGLLPKPARVSLRDRWLAGLQRGAIEKCDVLFLRHPKTGGTWLRVMLNQLYALKYGTSSQRVFRADELYRQNPSLPRFVVSNGVMSWERLVKEAFERGDPLVERPKVLFLARHPADVAVSWYIQITKRTKPFKRELIEAELKTPFDGKTISRWDFIRHPELGLPWLIDYHNLWIGHLHGRPNTLVTRYEDLRAAPEKTLGEITRFIGEEFTDEQLAEAVAFGSVENLRRLEREGYFRNNSLKLRDVADTETLKVRRAKVGGYSDDLTEEQRAWVDAQIAEKLDPRLGYGPVGQPVRAALQA